MRIQVKLFTCWEDHTNVKRRNNPPRLGYMLGNRRKWGELFGVFFPLAGRSTYQESRAWDSTEAQFE